MNLRSQVGSISVSLSGSPAAWYCLVNSVMASAAARSWSLFLFPASQSPVWRPFSAEISSNLCLQVAMIIPPDIDMLMSARQCQAYEQYLPPASPTHNSWSSFQRDPHHEKGLFEVVAEPNHDNSRRYKLIPRADNTERIGESCVDSILIGNVRSYERERPVGVAGDPLHMEIHQVV